MNEVANNNPNVNNNNNNNLSEALMENVQVVESTVVIMQDGSPMSQEAFLALEVHPLGKLFTGIVGSSYRSLKADIAEQGMTDAIVLYEGKILDGKVRHQICRELIQGNSFTGDIAVQTLPAGVAPLRYLISRNLQRRHLNESQRAIIGVRILTGAGKDFKGRTDEQVAELFNISQRQAIAAKQVIDKGAPEIIRLVEEGVIRVNTARNLIALSADSAVSLSKQQEAVRLAEEARAAKEVENAELCEKRQQKLSAMEAKLEQARENQKTVAQKENVSDDDIAKAATRFTKAKADRDKAHRMLDSARRDGEASCHEAMRKAFMEFLASEVTTADEPHDILLLVKMNGTLSVSCDIIRHQEHVEGIMLRECASRSEAEQYREEHRAEIDELVERARTQFAPIYEAMKSTAATLAPAGETEAENVA